MQTQLIASVGENEGCCWWERTTAPPPGNTVWQHGLMVSLPVPYDPAAPFLGI